MVEERIFISLVCREVSESQQSSLNYHNRISCIVIQTALCLKLIHFRRLQTQTALSPGKSYLNLKIKCFIVKKRIILSCMCVLPSKHTSKSLCRYLKHVVEMILTIYLHVLHSALYFWHFLTLLKHFLVSKVSFPVTIRANGCISFGHTLH